MIHLVQERNFSLHILGLAIRRRDPLDGEPGSFGAANGIDARISEYSQRHHRVGLGLQGLYDAATRDSVALAASGQFEHQPGVKGSHTKDMYGHSSACLVGLGRAWYTLASLWSLIKLVKPKYSETTAPSPGPPRRHLILCPFLTAVSRLTLYRLRDSSGSCAVMFSSWFKPARPASGGALGSGNAPYPSKQAREDDSYATATLSAPSQAGAVQFERQASLDNASRRPNLTTNTATTPAHSSYFINGLTTPTSASSTGEGGQGARFPPLPSSQLLASASHGYPPLRATLDRLAQLLLPRAPALRDSLSPGLNPLTSSVLLRFAAALAEHNYTLPPSVVETYALHDGQDPFSSTTSSITASDGDGSGLVYGLWWMSLEEVEREWTIWRSFEQRGGRSGMKDAFTLGDTRLSERSQAAAGRPLPAVPGKGKARQSQEGELELEESRIRQDEEGHVQYEEAEDERRAHYDAFGMSSFPPGWIKSKYSHSGWIPLLTDRAGNYIGVDLDPPSSSSPASPNETGGPRTVADEELSGQAGQVIAFGREIDEKVVLFPGHTAGGWGRFLAAFVDDVERGEFSRLKSDAEFPTAQADGRTSDDEWEDGDGLGDRGYLEGARYGDEESQMEENGDARVW